jgi:Uma2 family endonuclease
MVTNPICWTIHDLDALPDDGGSKRYEIIKGELFMTRAPHIWHQGAANKISTRLENWSEQTGLGRAFQTSGVIFTDMDAVIPDVVWASQARLANGLDEAGHFIIAPELIVEVLSAGEQNEQRDKSLKLKLYSLHGVQEYWIVNWQLKEVEVYRRQAAVLKKVETLMLPDTLTTPLLPGFECAIASLFPA